MALLQSTKNTSTSYTFTAAALIQATIIQILDDSKGLLTCLLASTLGHLHSIPKTPGQQILLKWYQLPCIKSPNSFYLKRAKVKVFKLAFLMLSHSTPITLTFFPFLLYFRHDPASGPLHLLFPLPGRLIPQLCSHYHPVRPSLPTGFIRICPSAPILHPFP